MAEWLSTTTKEKGELLLKWIFSRDEKISRIWERIGGHTNMSSYELSGWHLKEVKAEVINKYSDYISNLLVSSILEENSNTFSNILLLKEFNDFEFNIALIKEKIKNKKYSTKQKRDIRAMISYLK